MKWYIYKWYIIFLICICIINDRKRHVYISDCSHTSPLKIETKISHCMEYIPRLAFLREWWKSSSQHRKNFKTFQAIHGSCMVFVFLICLKRFLNPSVTVPSTRWLKQWWLTNDIPQHGTGFTPASTEIGFHEWTSPWHRAYLAYL